MKLAREEWKENRAFCQTVTFASAAFALPEALKAARNLLGRDRSS